MEQVIGPALVSKGFDPKTQLKDIDAFMKQLDDTPSKSRLGANAILGVSMACARAGAASAVGPQLSDALLPSTNAAQRVFLSMTSYEQKQA